MKTKQKQIIKLTESDLRNMVVETVKRVLTESDSFAQRYDKAKSNLRSPRMWGMELKNPEGEWEYGDIEFNPKTMEMSCMGATISVDEEWTIDAALEALLDELYNQGYGQE